MSVNTRHNYGGDWLTRCGQSKWYCQSTCTYVYEYVPVGQNMWQSEHCFGQHYISQSTPHHSFGINISWQSFMLDKVGVFRQSSLCSMSVDSLEQYYIHMQDNNCLRLPQMSNKHWCWKNEQYLNIDFNFDHQMSLSKSKWLYSNNCLHF
jgi:hypothetical protein